MSNSMSWTGSNGKTVLVSNMNEVHVKNVLVKQLRQNPSLKESILNSGMVFDETSEDVDVLRESLCNLISYTKA